MPPPDTATQAVRALVRAALAREAGAPVAAPRLDPALAPGQLVAAIYRQRVVELLADAAGGLDLPDAVVTRLAATRDRARLEILVQARDLVRAVTVLREHGIRCLAFKGLPLALQTTGDLTARSVGDLDLWVPSEDLERAHRLLQASGWAPPSGYPQPGPSWAWRHVRRTAVEVPLVESHTTIDLHWRLQFVQAGLPSFEEAWGRRDVVDVAGVDVATFGLPDALTHSCAHAAKDRWRWVRSLVDIHRLAGAPGAWPDVPAGPPMSSPTRASLSVTSALIGLPPATPSWVLAELGDAERLVRTAERAQAADRPGVHRFPGPGVVRGIIWGTRESTGPGEAWHVLQRALLPASVLGGISDRSAATAVPKAVLARGAQLPARLGGWWRHRG